jgi:hypothetical protein
MQAQRTKKTNEGYKEKQTLERSNMKMPVHRKEKAKRDPLECGFGVRASRTVGAQLVRM